MKFKNAAMHDGQLYDIGSEVPKMTTEQIKALQEAGVVEQSKAKIETKEDEKKSDVQTFEKGVSMNDTKADMVAYAKKNNIVVDETLTRQELFPILNKKEIK